MRHLLTTVAAVLALALLAAPAMAKEWDMVRIGTEGAYPPFNRVDENGELKGFDIDIAKALCKEMGVTCEFVVQDWDGLIPGLLAKKYDCIIASMSMTPERKERVDFTDKYYQTPARFVAHKNADFEISKSGLKGKVVGVQGGTTHENFVTDKFGDVVDIKPYTTLDGANNDLVIGRVDLALGDSVAFVEFLDSTQGKNYDFIGPGFTDVEYFGEGIGIAVRMENPELTRMLNEAIAAIRADGTYQRINAKYFDFDIYGD